VAYKAGQCVDYETPDYVIDNGDGDDSSGGDDGSGDGDGDNGGGTDDGDGGGDGGGDDGGGDNGGGDSTTCSTLAASIMKADVTCSGASDGQLTVDVAAGVDPVQYYWSNGATGGSLSGLAPGSYSVTVVDADGNTLTLNEVIASPGDIIIQKNAVAPTCNGSANGSIDISVTGGTSPYSYSWNNGASSEDLSGLASGLYTLTVTDANGCKKTSSTFMQNSVNILASASLTKPSNCGATDGAIDIAINGGTSPYTYSWSNGSTAQDISNLAGGAYSVTITDANGCQGFGNYQLAPTNTLKVEFIATPTACIDDSSGSIDLTVTGGTLPYTFKWSNNATTEDLINVKSGFYSVTVTDAVGCTAVLAINLPKETLQVVDQTTTPLCFGDETGSITLTPSGGTGPYTYNWSTGDTSGSVSDLPGGTYMVTITDALGCSRTLQYTIDQPQAISEAMGACSVSVIRLSGRVTTRLALSSNWVSTAPSYRQRI
jgi:hypothetical protein